MYISAIFSFAIASSSALADIANNLNWFPYLPRVSGTGWLSNQQFVAQGDAMAAIWGNQQNLFWGDVQTKNAFDSSWNSSLGAGYRYIYNDERILGSYLFIDRSNSLLGHHTFWDISPGVESLGRLWDFRLNAYFPVGEHSPLVSTGFADKFDDYQYVTFTGHQEWNDIVNLYQQTNTGVDGEIGRIIPSVPGLTVYIGSYYFAGGQNPNIRGATGRMQYEFNSRVAFEVADSYDNYVHNTVLAGIRFSLGGTGASDQDRSDITGRFLDPISRQLATQGQGTAIPVHNQITPISGPELEHDGIFFFAPDGTGNFSSNNDAVNNAQNCTFEHPCGPAAFNQATIDRIEGSVLFPSFYLATGVYDFNTQLNLSSNEFIQGWTPDFTEPAQGAERPILEGSFNLARGEDFTLDSLQLFNNPNSASQTQAINLSGNTSLEINNSLIGVNANSALAFATDIFINGDNNNLTINNSELHAYSAASAATGIWIYGEGNVNDPNIHSNNNSITLENSFLTADAPQDNGTGIWLDGACATDNGVGFNGVNYNTVTIDQSFIIADGLSGVGVDVNGHLAIDGGITGAGGNDGANYNTIDIKNGSEIIATGGNDSVGVNIDGSLAYDNGGNGGDGANHNVVNIQDSDVTASSVTGEAYGILLNGQFAGDYGGGGNNGANYNLINIDHSHINAISNQDTATGIMINGFDIGLLSSVTGNNGTNRNIVTIENESTVTANGGSGTGILVFGEGTDVAGDGANYNTITLDNSIVTAASTIADTAYGIMNDGTDGSAQFNTYNIQNNSQIDVTASDFAYGIYDTYAQQGNPNNWNINIPNGNFHLQAANICEESYDGSPC